jgi:hypothetical protein
MCKKVCVSFLFFSVFPFFFIEAEMYLAHLLRYDIGNGFINS